MNYISLYVLSEYSFLNSTCHISKLIQKAKEFNLSSLAICDDGVMYGSYKFYNECIKNNISPIIGLSLEVEVMNVIDKICLFASNNVGFKNLNILSSTYQINKKPITLDLLNEYKEGLICVTAGCDSQVYKSFKQNTQVISNIIETYRSLYSKFYIGLSTQTNDLVKLSIDYNNYFNQKNIKTVIFNKTQYINKNDFVGFQALKLIADSEYKFKAEEANAYYGLDEIKELNNAYLNTFEIADYCRVNLKQIKGCIPTFDQSLDSKKHLYELGLMGLKKRLSKEKNASNDVYLARFEKEYQTICAMGFADYFLIVYDYVRFAKTNGILVGPGRGSACSSLIAYSLGIHDVDPIKYNLLFERFLNSERVTMPDIDIDFPDDKREEVINYVKERYGKYRVAHISAFATFQGKQTINDVGKVLKLDENLIKTINKVVGSYDDSLSLVDIARTDDTIKKLLEEFPDVKKLLYIGSLIQGLPKSLSTHASGIVIADKNLFEYVGLTPSSDNILQTQVESNDLEALGLLKMDFLSLKNLSTIMTTCDLIKKVQPDFKLPNNLEVPNVYRMLKDGYVRGVFQLESKGMKKLLNDMQISCFNDLVAAIALYRPGPMDNIPHYLDCKFRRVKVTYPAPILEDILRETYGTIVYQEQIMLIAKTFAGYTLGQADILRRAISKKKKEIIDSERPKFIEASKRNGYSEIIAGQIFDIIEKFAAYGFNKTHSVGYAKLVFMTAYLKCMYPSEYISVLLNDAGSNEEVTGLISDAKVLGSKIYSPSINYSTHEYYPIKGGILLPLSCVKGISSTITKEVVKLREEKLFASFDDFLTRTKGLLSADMIEKLIFAGALDEFKLTKKDMVNNYKASIEKLEYSFIPGLLGPKSNNTEYTYSELLEKEKDVLGFNLKYNFKNQYLRYYQEHKLQEIGALQEGINKRTLGLVKILTPIKTKNNEDMCFMTITDGISDIECTLFPRVYNNYKNVIVNSIVEVCGKIEKRKELQLVVEQLNVIK